MGVIVLVTEVIDLVRCDLGNLNRFLLIFGDAIGVGWLVWRDSGGQILSLG